MNLVPACNGVCLVGVCSRGVSTIEFSPFPPTPLKYDKRLLDSRTRMNTRMRFAFKFFFSYFKKIDTPESSTVLFVTRRVSTVIIFFKVVKPPTDCKMIKLLTLMTCSRHNAIHAKTCNRMTTLKSSSSSRQSNAGSRVRTTSL